MKKQEAAQLRSPKTEEAKANLFLQPNHCSFNVVKPGYLASLIILLTEVNPTSLKNTVELNILTSLQGQ